MSLIEYLVSVIVFSAAIGFVSFLAYPGKSEKTIRFATALLLLYMVLAPVFILLSSYKDEGLEDIFNTKLETDGLENGEYLEVAENAFKEGIAKLLSEKYGARADEMNIFVYGFDFKSMRCERIKIVLFGKSAFLDARGMGAYITSEGLGKCEVDIRLG